MRTKEETGFILNQDTACVLIVAHVSASLKRQHTDVLLNFIAAITVAVIVPLGESGGGHGGTFQKTRLYNFCVCL